MRLNLFIVIASVLLAACGSPGQPVEEKQADQNSVKLTDTQRKNSGIEIGSVQKQLISEPIQATGMLDVPPQNLIDISAPYGGFVKSTSLLQGMKVRKGDVLVELQHPDYIQLQQDYLDKKSQLEYLKTEYARQQELSKENINAQKAVQQARAQYQSTLAMVQGLEAKLSLLNISADVLEQKGIQSSIRLYSPIQGYVTEVNINIGKFVSPADIMVKLVNTEHAHAELQVFEKDVTKIRTGQQVRFRLANDTTTRTAEVYLIGREISPERTVRIHCHLEKEDADLMPGMFLTAFIQTEPRTLTVIPSEAIVSHLGKSYVFIPAPTPNEFMLTPVDVGTPQGKFTSIALSQSVGERTPVVTKGAYTLLSMLFNTQEEE
jgi:cobalt-zinc-cadmium efflux system membrane fusion protein